MARDRNWRRLWGKRRLQSLQNPVISLTKLVILPEISPTPPGYRDRYGPEMFRFEGYTLDIARHSLRTADREVALRPKNFELLRYLVENPDRLVTKEELLKAIW